MSKKWTQEELAVIHPIEIFEMVLAGEIKRYPNQFWTGADADNNLKIVVRYLIEEKLKLTDEELKAQWGFSLLKKYKLYGMTKTMFDNSSIAVINAVYPGKFKIWELKKVSNGYWTRESAIEALKWLIEEELQLTDEELINFWSLKELKKYHLDKPIDQVFSTNLYEAIDAVYPGKFKAWQFKSVPAGFWNEERAIEAIKWVIEEKLRLTDDEVLNRWCRRFLVEHGLNGMVQLVFKNNIFDAIDTAYPGRFKPWQFKSVPKDFWTEETIIQAIKWLVEEELQLTMDEARQQWSSILLREYGLISPIATKLGVSLYEAFDLAYPGLYKPWEFPSVARGFWTEETAVTAIKWLIEEKLDIRPEEAKKSSICRLCKEHGLLGALYVFNGSPKKMLQAAYPHIYKKERAN